MRSDASLINSLPDSIRLSRRALDALEAVADKETLQLIQDILRLYNRTFPGEIKKIKSLPHQPWQADAGRFRILFHRSTTSPLRRAQGRRESRSDATLDILLIFPKSKQRSVFKGLSH